MSLIIRKQDVLRDESFGTDQYIYQQVEYESVSDTIKCIVNGNSINMSTNEWRNLFELINEYLQIKGHCL